MRAEIEARTADAMTGTERRQTERRRSRELETRPMGPARVPASQPRPGPL